MTDARRRVIGQRLAVAMRRAGVSQNRLARELGVSRSALSSWVHGQYQPSLEMLVELCKAIGVSPDEVLGVGPTKTKVDTARLTARCDRLERLVRDELAALRAEIERLKG